MNLMLLEPSEIDDQGRAVLRDRRARHICRVLGAGPGDRLRAGVINGALGTAEVVYMTGPPAPDAAPTVELLVRLDEQTAPPVPGMEIAVDVVLAVPRPKVLARVLQTAACMGVRRVDLVNAWRVDKSHLASHELLPAALRHNLVLGCEQGGSTALPEIALHRLLMPFVRGPLGERLARGRARPIIAHPRAAMVLEQAVPPGTSESVIVAIGPERGWIEREVETFTALGFAPVALGARVLRVEAAMTAALAQLELLRRL